LELTLHAFTLISTNALILRVKTLRLKYEERLSNNNYCINKAKNYTNSDLTHSEKS